MGAIQPEAEKYYRKAIEIWNNQDDHNISEKERNDIGSYLALAIKKAGGIYPLAQSRLSFLMLSAGKLKEASNLAEKTLLQDPNSFIAQYVLVLIQIGNIGDGKLSLKSFVPKDWNSAVGFAIDFALRFYATLFSFGVDRVSYKNLTDKLNRLIQIYRFICTNKVDENEYITYSQSLIQLGDGFSEQKVKLPGGTPNLFNEVISIPLSNIFIINHENEITEIREMAEGRAELFNSQP